MQCNGRVGMTLHSCKDMLKTYLLNCTFKLSFIMICDLIEKNQLQVLHHCFSGEASISFLQVLRLFDSILFESFIGRWPTTSDGIPFGSQPQSYPKQWKNWCSVAVQMCVSHLANVSLPRWNVHLCVNVVGNVTRNKYKKSACLVMVHFVPINKGVQIMRSTENYFHS